MGVVTQVFTVSSVKWVHRFTQSGGAVGVLALGPQPT